MGHSRRFSDVRDMSGLPSIAVVMRRAANGREGPEADITYAARSKIKSQLPEAFYADQTRETTGVSYAFEPLVRCAVIK